MKTLDGLSELEITLLFAETLCKLLNAYTCRCRHCSLAALGCLALQPSFCRLFFYQFLQSLLVDIEILLHFFQLGATFDELGPVEKANLG